MKTTTPRDSKGRFVKRPVVPQLVPISKPDTSGLYTADDVNRIVACKVEEALDRVRQRRAAALSWLLVVGLPFAGLAYVVW